MSSISEKDLLSTDTRSISSISMIKQELKNAPPSPTNVPKTHRITQVLFHPLKRPIVKLAKILVGPNNPTDQRIHVLENEVNSFRDAAAKAEQYRAQAVKNGQEWRDGYNILEDNCKEWRKLWEEAKEAYAKSEAFAKAQADKEVIPKAGKSPDGIYTVKIIEDPNTGKMRVEYLPGNELLHLNKSYGSKSKPVTHFQMLQQCQDGEIEMKGRKYHHVRIGSKNAERVDFVTEAGRVVVDCECKGKSSDL